MELNMSKFIIYASARTGSTSLAKVLAESPDVKMAIEPFHPNYTDWNPSERNYSDFITNPEKMNEAMDEIFSKVTAIKVLDYQFDEDIYKAMLSRKEFKVLFLRRKNVIRSSLSSLVAEQTSEYHKQDDESIYDNLEPIDINKMKEMVDYVAEMNEGYAKFLEKNRKDGYMPLFYEELYSEDFETNKSTLSKICSFLEIKLPPDDAIREHMTPLKAKINYKNIYRKIPNIKDVEEKFGDIS